MAKGRDRQSKEARKPKADKNIKKKGTATPPQGGAARPALDIARGKK